MFVFPHSGQHLLFSVFLIVTVLIGMKLLLFVADFFTTQCDVLFNKLQFIFKESLLCTSFLDYFCWPWYLWKLLVRPWLNVAFGALSDWSVLVLDITFRRTSRTDPKLRSWLWFRKLRHSYFFSFPLTHLLWLPGLSQAPPLFFLSSGSTLETLCRPNKYV